jgi:hypothetical protein
MSREQAMRRLSAANPISTEAISTVVPEAQRTALLERIVRVPREQHAETTDVTQRADDTSPNGRPIAGFAALRAVVRRERRPSRRMLVLLAFFAAAVLAGTAYAVVHELILGSPAPLEVRQQPARFGHSAELIPVPHPADPRLDEARVAAVLDSSGGTVYLFSSPDGRGGLCASTWIEGDRGYQGRLNLSGVCGTSDQSFFSFGSQEYHGKSVRLFSGHARDGVARVAVGFAEKTVDVPLNDGWFLAEFPKQPDEFVSYDADGRVLEQHQFPSGSLPPRSHIVQPPHQVTQAREIARLTAEDGSEQITLFVARASDGGYCQIVRSNQRPSNSGCSNPQPQPGDIGVDAMNFGGAPGGVLLLVGRVGTKISALELNYQDGRTVNVPLNDGWALYEVVRADYAEGRRPQVLIGRDASGNEIASKRLPWATGG